MDRRRLRTREKGIEKARARSPRVQPLIASTNRLNSSPAMRRHSINRAAQDYFGLMARVENCYPVDQPKVLRDLSLRMLSRTIIANLDFEHAATKRPSDDGMPGFMVRVGFEAIPSVFAFGHVPIPALPRSRASASGPCDNRRPASTERSRLSRAALKRGCRTRREDGVAIVSSALTKHPENRGETS